MADTTTTSDAPAPAAATTAADVAGIETVESGGGGGGAGGGAGAATAAAAAGGGADSGAADADADGGFDSSTKKIVQKIPLLSIRAGPRDADWKKRLKQEYKALIQVSFSHALTSHVTVQLTPAAVCLSTSKSTRRTTTIGSPSSQTRAAHSTQYTL